jgi:hypothetical protein
MEALLASMAVAEQYLSWDSLTARSTTSRRSPFPRHGEAELDPREHLGICGGTLGDQRDSRSR